MSLDNALQKAISQIPECVAGGYVDLSTGMLLAIRTVDSHPQNVLDFLAAATTDLFQGPNVVMIENAFKKARGVEGDKSHYFQEIVVLSENLVHVFVRTKKNQDHVACFVCRKSVNLGMALSKTRVMIAELEQAA
jgi:hypothetical protein